MFAFIFFNIQHKVEAIYKTVQNMNKNKISYMFCASECNFTCSRFSFEKKWSLRSAARFWPSSNSMSGRNVDLDREKKGTFRKKFQ